VLHVGDIEAQTLRSWENVGVLLEEAGMSFDDVTVMIIYVRNRKDFEAVDKLYDERFGGSIPKLILAAPICRPTWLMETECIAVKR
jgi:enamine deaminase RidA (YjgF/YER057c/UK114 family)